MWNFLDFQKALDTLIRNLTFYGVRGITSKCLSWYFEKRVQFAGINSSSSDLQFISIVACHYFDDDTNLLNLNRFIQTINNHVNYDLKDFHNLINANKVYLNAIQLKLFSLNYKKETTKKQFDSGLHHTLNTKQLYTINQ